MSAKLILIEGEPGSGKTKLANIIARGIADQEGEGCGIMRDVRNCDEHRMRIKWACAREAWLIVTTESAGVAFDPSIARRITWKIQLGRGGKIQTGRGGRR